jgi:hypothetical protein
MSNSLAIAAVTATLRDVLSQVAQPLPFDPDPETELNDATCSTKPPDRARQNESTNQLNLFLYSTAWSSALRNADIPRQVRPGETAMSPVALTLFYLVTAYGRNNDDLLSHRLLGRAMTLLHDRAILLPGDVDKSLKGNDLGKQVERVRITPHTISNEELSKLWAVFQTPYRISVSYEVSVVLLDSARRTKAPPPVLSRGVTANSSVLPPYPELTSFTLPLPAQPSARLPSPAPPVAIPGDTITFAGHDLAGLGVTVALSHPLLEAPRLLPPLAGATASAFQVELPNDQANLPAGFYAVSARIHKTPLPAQDLFTNSIALAVAPRLRSVAVSARDADGNVTLTALVSPEVWPAQRAALILDDVEVLARSHITKTDTLEFITDLPAKTYWLRLRVDGVDSFLVDYAASPPAYDPTQAVTLP